MLTCLERSHSIKTMGNRFWSQILHKIFYLSINLSGPPALFAGFNSSSYRAFKEDCFLNFKKKKKRDRPTDKALAEEEIEPPTPLKRLIGPLNEMTISKFLKVRNRMSKVINLQPP